MAIVSSIFGALLITVLYYIAIHLLDKRLKLELGRRRNLICTPAVCIVGLLNLITWSAAGARLLTQVGISQLILLMIIVCGTSVLTITDMSRQIIPNRFLMLLLLLWAAVTGLTIILSINEGMALLFTSLAGGIVAGLIFLLCYFISRRQLGAGDVKLVFVMGLCLTGQRIMGAIFYGVVLCCVYSLVQLCRKKIGIRDGIPMVPFLYLGALVTLVIL